MRNGGYDSDAMIYRIALTHGTVGLDRFDASLIVSKYFHFPYLRYNNG
jgi:hypothetical protein